MSSYHDDTSLVVGQHDWDKASVGAHHRNDILHLHTSCHLRHRYQCHICDKNTVTQTSQARDYKSILKIKCRFVQLLLPALPSLCRCSAASLTESCSTLVVIMWGRPVHPFCCPSPCSAALEFLLKCSTAVWSTRLFAWKIKTAWQWTTDENCQYFQNHSIAHKSVTSVPPEVKIMSSALPPTILATFSLDWLMIDLALAPMENKMFYVKILFVHSLITTNLMRWYFSPAV